VDRVGPAAPFVNPVEGDDNVSTAERQNGVRITGTAERGAGVRVIWNGDERTATAEDGAWSVDYTADRVPTGPSTQLRVIATDLPVTR
jgi:hypothetical protein